MGTLRWTVAQRAWYYAGVTVVIPTPSIHLPAVTAVTSNAVGPALKQQCLGAGAVWEVLIVYVYFVRAGEDGPIKIGKTTTSPFGRMSQLQGAHYLKLHLIGVIVIAEYPDGTYANGVDWKKKRENEERLAKLETSIHAAFDEERIRGEWFEPSEALMDFIKTRVDCSFGSKTGKQKRLERVEDILGVF